MGGNARWVGVWAIAWVVFFAPELITWLDVESAPVKA